MQLIRVMSMDEFELKNAIKELLVRFHSSELPDIVHRELNFQEFKKVNKVIVVIGPRRAGKTFVLYQLIKRLLDNGHTLKSIVYLNFEDERLAELRADQLDLILTAYGELYGEGKPFLFLDEIQNVTGWERFVRRLNDENYKVYVSGSNSKLLSKEIATSLRGRDYPVQVLPFSFREFINVKGIKLGKGWEFGASKTRIRRAFDEYAALSGFPEIVLENRLDFVDQYFKTMLFQDIIERYRITNTDLMRLFMQFLARQYGSDYSINKFNNFAKSSSYKSSTSTVQKYSKIVEDIYFCFFLRAKQRSFRKESAYLKKVYLFDHGFINYYGTEVNSGRLLENIVAIELMRRKEAQLNYYTNGFECDFITKENSIQVCHTINEGNRKREINGLMEARKKFGNKPILITYDQESWFGGVRGVPIWKWLLEDKN
ncbi:MAG: ATP-binding protein [Candidatus Micrarchaeota archaeon]|nr:ATP-binding protein [Candidatus Micrarchaeota archaeon]